jgi:hypothetical protein
MNLKDKILRGRLRSKNAYAHYQNYIASKNDVYTLSFGDLLYVKNYLGSNSKLTEPPLSCAEKLLNYEDRLRRCAQDEAFNLNMRIINNADYLRVRKRIIEFSTLPLRPEFLIAGFDCLASITLLHFYFPNLVPLIDRDAIARKIYGEIKTNYYGEISDPRSAFLKIIGTYRRVLEGTSSQTTRRPRLQCFGNNITR